MSDQLKEIKVPFLGVNDEHAILAEWLVESDNAVKVGDPIAILETTKATQEIEAELEGLSIP